MKKLLFGYYPYIRFNGSCSDRETGHPFTAQHSEATTVWLVRPAIY